ncbi:MAG TPA: hypothetical protein VFC01_33115 [Mycobacterium sp.]|nr:hypothetical protein [Mycobacterium sp.]
MNAAQKIAAFVAGLVMVFTVAIWVGRTVGPEGGVDVRQAPPHEDSHAAHDAGAPEPLGGLAVVQDGYTLDLTEDRGRAAKDVPLRFRILDGNGAPVTRYVEKHEKLLHLIVVRSDLAGFQHVHPVLESDGTWRVPVDLSRAGDYRIFADFTPSGGPALTLGANLHVGGEYDPQPLPPVAATTVVDGYTVALSGAPKANEPSMLTLAVSRNGKPVTDLQPYLGAYGHLVALRAADLGYLHVHPMGEPGDGITAAGPEIAFHATFPSAGAYRLFLDFQHDGVVRTAAFTVTVEDGEAT